MLTHLGSEFLGFLGDGTKALTIPEGTTAILLSTNRYGGFDVTPSIGGINGVVNPDSDLFWLWDDISGRSNDTLTHGTAGNSTDTSAYYLSGILPAWYGGGATTSYGTSDAPENGGNVFGAWTASGYSCSLSPDTDELSHGGSGIPPYQYNGGWADVGEPGAAIDCGPNISCFTGAQGAYAFIYESEVIITLEPTSFGAEAGFQTGITFGIESTVDLFIESLGAEAGFQEGILFEITSGRQVALVGNGLDMPDRTKGGTEGQVLTQHVGRRPTWEDAYLLEVAEADGDPDVTGVTRIEFDGATVTDDTDGQVTITIAPPASALDDLSDVDAAAPTDGDTLTWVTANSAWEAVAPIVPASALDDLSDVNAAAPSDTQVLTWDADPGEWIAADALAGADGADGADGATWFAQAAEPVANQAGDLWLDTDDGEVYEWDGDSWESVGNIMGTAGTNGTDGADGSLWFAQSAAPAANQTGDLWLDTDDGDVKQWDGDSWEVVDNLTGPTGAAGASLATDTLWAAAGDIAYATADDTATVLTIGSAGDVLTVAAGIPSWAAPAAAGDITTDPAWAAAGDLIVATGNDAASVLTAGSEGDVLTITSGVPAWGAPAAAGDITTDVAWAAKGDLIVATANNTAAVVSIGSTDDVLTVVAGTAAWAAPTGGAVPPALRVYLYSTFK